MSGCDPELCWNDVPRMDCGDFVCPEHDPEVQVTRAPESEGGHWLHARGTCKECDSCWEDVDANRAVTCPTCDGGGVLNECRNPGFCSHTDDREWKCSTCAETGVVPPENVDREGELITFDGCNCDEDTPCSDAKCQMERALEMRYMQALYRAGALTPPRDMQQQMYSDILHDAGRDYLLSDDERMPF